MAFAKSLRMKSDGDESQVSESVAETDGEEEEEFFKHVMNDIEDFFRTNKIIKRDFLQMKTIIE